MWWRQRWARCRAGPPPAAPACRRRPPRAPDDAPAQLAGDEGPHDLEPQPCRALRREAGGQAHPVVLDRDHEPVVASASAHEHDAVPVPQPVLDGVGDELGQRQRQRCRVLGPDRAEGAQPSRARPALGARDVHRQGQAPSATASKSTHSSKRCDSVSCTSAIVVTRRIASARASRASGLVDPARLQPQQRRHGLQVVLHPVVDLADRGVLGQQLLLPAPELGDVAAQQQRPGPLAAGAQRHRAHRQRHAPGLDLGPPGGTAGRAPRAATRPPCPGLGSRSATASARVTPDEVPDQPDPVERRDGVGAGVEDAPSVSRWIIPSPTRGAPRRPPVGAPAVGYEPSATIAVSASAHRR